MTAERLAEIESHVVAEHKAVPVAVVGVETAELLSLIAEVKFWREMGEILICARHTPLSLGMCRRCREHEAETKRYWDEIRKEPRP